MRIGLISDIHGNLVALETVLYELDQESIDQIICLGDVAAIGPQPREVIDRLHTLNCPIILGNTDAWLLTPPQVKPELSEDVSIMYEITSWGSEQLSQANRAFVSTFSPTLTFPLDEEKNLSCYHGSPRSFDDVIAAITSDVEVKRMLDGFSATIFAGGHTHIQMLRRYKDAYIVNVGSIGLPGVNAGSPELPMNHQVHWAEYGVLSVERGRLSIDLRRIPLDMNSLLQAARRSRMPHLNWWIQKWKTDA